MTSCHFRQPRSTWATKNDPPALPTLERSRNGFPGPFSNWRIPPRREVLTTVSAKAVLPKLDAIFSRQGIAEVLKIDNGQPFNGTKFESYAKHCGFTQRKIIPYWPQANGEAERFMRTFFMGCHQREEELEAEPVSPQLQGKTPFHH